jgi:hypothetical protein
MGLRERAIEWLGAVNVSEFDQRINRAYEAGFYDGNDDPATGDFKKGGQGYKRLSDKFIRDGKIDYNRAIETAWGLWQKSPIAKRVLAMKRDHIVGHSAMPDSNDDNLVEILNEFWQGNNLEKRSSEFTMQLFGFGEQCYPVFVREADGRVRLGYIDPASIDKVVKHPDNALEDWAVVAQRYDHGGYTNEKLVYRIVRAAEDFTDGEEVTTVDNPGKLITDKQAELEPWESEMLAKYKHDEYDGSCFYTKVNAVSNQSRGMSDLLQIGDWLDQADNVLFSMADREQFAGYFAFDVTLVRASKDHVATRNKELRDNMPKKGSVNVHNDSESWEMWSPDLHQSGSIESFRALLGLILGGVGFPVHWYGFGDDANRATATVQADPTTKSLEHDQATVRDMFLSMCRFVADQAEIAGNYTPVDDLEISLTLPEVSTKDLARTTTSMQGIVIGLSNAQDNGWISEETAAKAFAKIMAELDIQYDVIAELEQVGKDGEQSELANVERTNGQLQMMLAQQAEDANGNRSGA